MNDSTKIRFKTDLTNDDYLGLCWIKVNKLVYAIIIVIAAAVSYTIYPRLKDSLWLLVIIAFGVFAAFYFLMKFYVKWRANSVFKRSRVSTLLVLTIDDEGITQKSDFEETKLLWEDVYRVRENKDCFFVFLNPSKAFYFPKRSFENKEQRESFIALIIEKIPPAKVFFK